MAKNQAPTKKARALLDLNQYGFAVPCGAFFTGPAELVDQIIGYGVADEAAKESDVYGDDIPPAVEVAIPVADEAAKES